MKKSFFVDKKNQQYISWKAIPVLRKYLTRFGDIKPRKYTGVNVKTQKRIRRSIIRARELGLLPYIR